MTEQDYPFTTTLPNHRGVLHRSPNRPEQTAQRVGQLQRQRHIAMQQLAGQSGTRRREGAKALAMVSAGTFVEPDPSGRRAS